MRNKPARRRHWQGKYAATTGLGRWFWAKTNPTRGRQAGVWHAEGWARTGNHRWIGGGGLDLGVCAPFKPQPSPENIAFKAIPSGSEGRAGWVKLLQASSPIAHENKLLWALKRLAQMSGSQISSLCGSCGRPLRNPNETPLPGMHTAACTAHGQRKKLWLEPRAALAEKNY